MTGATLKTRLEGLGLPPSWFGARLGVSMRTVVRWFDGDGVESRIVDELERLSERTLAEMVEMIDGLPDEDPVTLWTYRTDKGMVAELGEWPASWHRSLTFRVWEHLRAQEREVVIEYRDPVPPPPLPKETRDALILG